MKHLYALFFTGLLCLTANAQDTATTSEAPPATVEKSIFNAQIGTLGIWGNWEARLGSKFALRTEIGLDAVGSINNDHTQLGLAPSLTLEPRWYYNIAKRSRKGKNTAKNGANFFTVSFKYLPDTFVITGEDDANVLNQIYIIPKWGIRRNIGSSNFNYEAGIGIGYMHIFVDKDHFYSGDESDVAVDLHLRIGYTFK